MSERASEAVTSVVEMRRWLSPIDANCRVPGSDPTAADTAAELVNIFVNIFEWALGDNRRGASPVEVGELDQRCLATHSTRHLVAAALGTHRPQADRDPRLRTPGRIVGEACLSLPWAVRPGRPLRSRMTTAEERARAEATRAVSAHIREERSMADIEQLDGPPARAEAITEEILGEYLMWCGERLTADCGVVFDHPDAVVAAHHREFAQELPHLLGPRGRLLVARANSEVVGVGALKPVDSTVAEIKRMYVRPQARGQGIGRAILERLLADACAIGYQVARLETATFMSEAHALYRSLGFQDRPIFDHTEASLSGLERFMRFMELRLDQAAPV